MSRNVAIVLASGAGKRMGSEVPKQFMEVGGKPLIYYALKAYNSSEYIDEVVMATSDIELCKEIVTNNNFTKVTKIVSGGKERYHSVYNALMAIDDCDYVFIHDGARPNVDEEIIKSSFEAAKAYGAAVAAVKVKDTIKISDANGFVESTPDRATLYSVQTPQTFDFKLIKSCYEKLIANEEQLLKDGVHITDDAMVEELYGDKKVFLSEGSYSNIKVTTPEDLGLVNI